MKPRSKRAFIALQPAAALLLALAAGFVFLALSGRDAVESYSVLLTAPLTRLARAGRWIEASASLTLAGLAFFVPAKLKLLNFGIFGQAAFGGLGAILLFTFLPLPEPLALLVASMAAAVFGALAGTVPGILKAHLHASEIVTSLMLNPILATSTYAVYDIAWPLFSHSARIAERGQQFGFPRIEALTGWETGTLHSGIMLAPMACLVVWWLLTRSTIGYEVSITGANQNFARYGGVPTERATVLAFAIGGACAGLAGACFALGHPGDMVPASAAITFDGIAVAVLAAGNPAVLGLTGLLYGYIVVGADYMEIRTGIGQELIRIVQGLMLLLLPLRVTLKRVFKASAPHPGHTP